MGILDIFKNIGKRDQPPEPVPTFSTQIAAPNSEAATVKILERVSQNGMILSKNPADYPKWFSYTFGITDPYKRMMELIQQGLIYIIPVDIGLKKLKVSELKEELERQGLSSKGNKDALINRLVNEGEISPMFAPDVVELTDKGKQWLSEKQEEMYASSLERFSISLRDYFNKKSIMPTHKKEEVAISLLLEKQYALRLDFWIYYDIQYELAKLYHDIGDNSNSLPHYIGYAYYACCATAKYSNTMSNLETRFVNPIYSLKSYYKNDMIDFCKTLPVPNDGSAAKYNIRFFKKQIEQIIK